MHDDVDALVQMARAHCFRHGYTRILTQRVRRIWLLVGADKAKSRMPAGKMTMFRLRHRNQGRSMTRVLDRYISAKAKEMTKPRCNIECKWGHPRTFEPKIRLYNRCVEDTVSCRDRNQGYQGLQMTVATL